MSTGGLGTPLSLPSPHVSGKSLENCQGPSGIPAQEQPGEQMCARLSPRPCTQSTDYALFSGQSGEGPWHSAFCTPQNSTVATWESEIRFWICAAMRELRGAHLSGKGARPELWETRPQSGPLEDVPVIPVPFSWKVTFLSQLYRPRESSVRHHRRSGR